MSIAALTLSLYHSKAIYSTRLVLIAIANFEGENGAYPSHDTIGRLSGGLNRRTVQRAIDDLVKLGELSEIRREGQTNLYRVAITCPDECDRSSSHRQKLGGGVQTAGGDQTATGSGVQTATGAVSRPPEPLDNRKNNPTNQSEQFDEFWNEYPKKEGKKPAFKAFASALRRATFEDILAGVIRYKNSDRVTRGYVMLASRWLNEDHWEDNLEPSKDSEAAERSKQRRDRELEASRAYLAELKAQEAEASAPKTCRHGKNLALCLPCSKETNA